MEAIIEPLFIALVVVFILVLQDLELLLEATEVVFMAKNNEPYAQ